MLMSGTCMSGPKPGRFPSKAQDFSYSQLIWPIKIVHSSCFPLFHLRSRDNYVWNVGRYCPPKMCWHRRGLWRLTSHSLAWLLDPALTRSDITDIIIIDITSSQPPTKSRADPSTKQHHSTGTAGEHMLSNRPGFNPYTLKSSLKFPQRECELARAACHVAKRSHATAGGPLPLFNAKQDT
jgi:hypothetical protein